MNKIKKGTFVFEKNHILSAGFFVSAKQKTKRTFGMTWKEPEIIIKDLWTGRDTHFGSLDSPDHLSTDKKVFKEYVLSLITKHKESISENNKLLTSSMKRKITIHEKNKKQTKTEIEEIQSLANDLDFYEKMNEDLLVMQKTA